MKPNQTLDGLWQIFREQTKLNNAPKPQEQALEYAFKAGVASTLILCLDLQQEPAHKAQVIMHNMMNDFGEFLKYRGRPN